MIEQTLMAFWEYDRFPYTLHSEVVEFIPTRPNVVKVKGYGGGCFKYNHIVPIEVGTQLVVELDKIEKEYKREMTSLSLTYHSKLAEIAKKYGLPVSKI